MVKCILSLSRNFFLLGSQDILTSAKQEFKRSYNGKVRKGSILICAEPVKRKLVKGKQERSHEINYF